MLSRMNDNAAVPPMPGQPAPFRTARRTRLTALIVACALFMQNMDSTVIATALPTIAKAFGAEPTHMNVALTSYMLSLAVFIPCSGWLADRFGTRTIFRLAIVVFTIGSVLSGSANSLTFLVLARILQGFGGAMMVPVGRLLLLRTVPKSEMVAAMAWLSTPALLGPVLGPPLGGFIVTYFSWRYIFAINIPIGLLGILLVTLFIEDIREPTRLKFDWRGFAFSSVALGCLMFGLETLGRGVVPKPISLAALALGSLSGACYAAHALNHPRPIIDFTLLRIPTFAVAIVAGTLFRIGIGAIPFLLPMMLQLTFGQSPAESGLITFASSLGALFMKPAATGALRRLGFRDTLVWNAVLSAALLSLCAFFTPAWPAFFIYTALLLGGFFRSLQFTAYNALAYADVPRDRMSSATGFYSAMQQISLTVGVSIAAASLTLTMALTNHSTPLLSDFSTAFLIVATISMCAAPLALTMPRTAATELSGHRGR